MPTDLIKGMRELAEFLGKKLDKTVAALSGIKLEYDNRPIVVALTKILSALKERQETSVSVAVDTTAMEAELRAATKELRKMKPADTKKVETLLSNTVIGLNQLRTATEEKLGAVLLAVQSLKLEMPGTVKLDEMQVRSLTPRMPTTNVPLVPRSVTVANVSMASANTEYSYTFPRGTVAWELRVRSTNQPLLVAYTTGKLPTSGDGGAYFTVPAYYVSTNSGLDWGAKTIYLQTAGTSQVCEVISYQAV